MVEPWIQKSPEERAAAVRDACTVSTCERSNLAAMIHAGRSPAERERLWAEVTARKEIVDAEVVARDAELLKKSAPSPLLRSRTYPLGAI